MAATFELGHNPVALRLRLVAMHRQRRPAIHAQLLRELSYVRYRRVKQYHAGFVELGCSGKASANDTHPVAGFLGLHEDKHLAGEIVP
jgi:hypothetical protein